MNTQINIYQIILVSISLTAYALGSNEDLIRGAKIGCISTIEKALQRGAYINARDNTGRTALHWAVIERNYECMEFLLQNPYYYVLIDFQDRNGNTPLHEAAYLRDTNYIKLLLDKRAQVHLKNNKGKTVLHIVAFLGYVDSLRLLLEKCYRVDEKDNQGQTALHKAASQGNLGCLKLLIAKGASINKKDIYGKTAFTCASLAGYSECVSFLLEKGATIVVVGSYETMKKILEITPMTFSYRTSGISPERMNLLIEPADAETQRIYDEIDQIKSETQKIVAETELIRVETERRSFESSMAIQRSLISAALVLMFGLLAVALKSEARNRIDFDRIGDEFSALHKKLNEKSVPYL